MTHPLTDEILQKFDGYGVIDDAMAYDEDDICTAADWQLEQVLQWLDENLSKYTDTYEYIGDLNPMHKLTTDLKKAMRPQEDS